MDVNGTADYTHVSGESTASFFVNFALPIFNRNQGEIPRTGYALTQAQELQQSASDTVLSDVANAYEAVRSNDEVVQLYNSGYLSRRRIRAISASMLTSGEPQVPWISSMLSAATVPFSWPIARHWVLI